MKKIDLIILVLLCLLICTRCQPGRVDPTITRIDPFSISMSGSYQYSLSPLNDIDFGQEIKASPDRVSFLAFDSGLDRNTYKISRNSLSIPIPVLGEKNDIDFFIKSPREGTQYIVIKVYSSKKELLRKMITEEYSKITIAIDDNDTDIKDNRLDLYFEFAGVPLMKLDNTASHASHIIMSDLCIKGENPRPLSHRYSNHRWISDRIFIPGNSSLIFDIDSVNDSELFFTYHLFDFIRKNNADNGIISVISRDRHGNEHILADNIGLRSNTTIQKVLLPLKKTCKTIEIRFTSHIGDNAAAVGNIMILPKIPKVQKKDVFLICIDTLRRDHMGVYGYYRDTTPNIDKLSENSMIFTKATSNSSWTMPSAFYHYFGQYPFDHQYEWGYTGRIDDSLISGVESFKENNYITIGIMGNFLLSDRFGYARGFDLFYESYDNSWVLGHDITNEAIDLIDILSGHNLFMNLWYIDPHDPYDPPELFSGKYIFKGNRDDYLDTNHVHEMIVREIVKKDTEIDRLVSSLIDQYDSTIQYVDECVGKLIDFLRHKHLYDDSLIVLFADHGEEFFEHRNLKHAHALFEESVAVPLIFKQSNNKKEGEIYDHPVDLTDIFPTLWDIMEIKRPDTYTLGQNLMIRDYDRLIISTTAANKPYKIMLRKNNKKLIRYYKEYNSHYDIYFSDESAEFQKLLNIYANEIYPSLLILDLDRNPGEVIGIDRDNDLAKYQDYFQTVLADFENRVLSQYQIKKGDKISDTEETLEFDDEILEKLRALGYIN